MSKLEIEKRYLFNSCNIFNILKSYDISYIITTMEQFYLKATIEETLRYRKEDNIYIKNIKKGSGLVRQELEEEITKQDYLKAKKQNSGGVIKKIRVTFLLDGNRYELDIFKGKLKGLSILEVEFQNIYEANNFEINKLLKPFVIKEITNQNIYSNGALSHSMKIPLREDSHLSLKDFNIKNAKFDLYISEFENSKFALKNYLLRFYDTFEYNLNIFYKTYSKIALNRAIKAIKRLKSLIIGFKKYIKKEVYTKIIFNINKFLLSINEYKNYKNSFKLILKDKQNYSIDFGVEILKSLISIAQKIKSLKISVAKKYNNNDLITLKKLLLDLKYKKSLEKPFCYMREKILKREYKKLKKAVKEQNIELISYRYKIYKDLSKFFNNPPKKGYFKLVKKSIKYKNSIKIIEEFFKTNSLKEEMVENFNSYSQIFNECFSKKEHILKNLKMLRCKRYE